MKELGIVFLLFLLLALVVTGCSRKTVPTSNSEKQARENGSTVWLNIPNPPPQPGLNYKPPQVEEHDKVIFFNAATDNSGNPIDTAKVYMGKNGAKYTWKISKKSKKPYKKYLKE